MEHIQCIILKPIEIAVVSVCSDKNTVLKKLTQDLRVTFKTYLTPSLRNINIEERNLKTAQNVDQLEEIIISTDVNIILILASTLMIQNIEVTIKKVEDAKHNIGHVFARISAYTKKSFNILQTYYASRNKTLIFSITGNAKEILECIKETASTMVLGAYLFQRVTEIWEKEEETKNRLQEEDEISYTRQRELPSLLKFPTSNIDENISDETYQKTCQFISVKDALSLIKLTVINDHKIFSPLESEFVEVKNAFGRIVCQAVTSCSDIPSFLVATKSGYAVRVEKEENKMETNELSETSTIILDSDTAVLVGKGKRIPLDTATAVIPTENVRVSNDEAKILINSYTVKYGQNVMFPGSDIKKGDLIVGEFTRIFSKEIMLLLTCGCKNVKVFEKLSLGVLTIGNNLLDVGESLKPKYSYDCNRVLLLSLLEDNNFNLNLKNFGITVEDPICLKTKITEVLEKVDLLVTTGCSNNKNYLKEILKTDFQATFLFENVDIKPGKSTAFAKCYFKNKPKIILCLPRNTASVFVTAHVFLLPLINWIHFNFREDWPIINVEVDKQLLLHRRPRYVWATLSWEEELYPKITCKEEHSINNLSYNDDNVLLILPPKTPEKSTLEASSRVPAMLVKPPFSKIQI